MIKKKNLRIKKKAPYCIVGSLWLLYFPQVMGSLLQLTFWGRVGLDQGRLAGLHSLWPKSL